MRLRYLILSVGIAMLATSPVLAAEIALPSGANRSLVYGNCRTCHDLQYIVDSAGITRQDWDGILESMQLYGMRLEPEGRKKILDYLATYLGPKPPPSPPATRKRPPKTVAGASVYSGQCIACHGKDGRGTGKLFPPLAKNRDLFIDQLFPVYVVLHGLSGPITIAGERFNGVMPSFAHLSDQEIAAVINYVRTAWSNSKLRPSGMQAIDSATVKNARERRMTSTDVNAYRGQHR